MPGLARLTAPDRWLTARVERWRAPRWLRRWLVVASRAGDGSLWTLAGVMVLLDGGAARWSIFGAAAVAAGLGVLAFEALKLGVRRSRPQLMQACGGQPPRAWAWDRYSFPSGHTATAFAVVQPLIYAFPRAEYLLLFIAFNIAASRILLGLHFLSDVLVGTALGWTVGYIASAWVIHLR